MRTTDRRFIKTEKIIFNSMVDLLQKSDPESLLIDDLVNEADINKSTFYLHYQSLDQLISAIEDRLIAGISSVLYGVGESGSLEEAFKGIRSPTRMPLSRGLSSKPKSLYCVFG